MSLIRNVCRGKKFKTICTVLGILSSGIFGFLIGIRYAYLVVIEAFIQDSLSRRKDGTIKTYKTYADLRRK